MSHLILLVERMIRVSLMLQRIGIWCGLLLLLNSAQAQEKYDSEEDLIKGANTYFKEGDFAKSMPLYAQLVSLYPQNGEYNYKYGASLIYAEADKTKCLKYLKFASTKSGVDNLSNYYLGLAHHLNYNFPKAKQAYQKFLTNGDKGVEKGVTERLIDMCDNGVALLDNILDVGVIEKKEVTRKEFYRVYKPEGIEGKIIVRPEQFTSKLDAKETETSLLFLPSDAKVLYFSSYGDNKNNGLDIFRVTKLEDGEWSTPENLGPTINTPFDESYPFMHSDGRTLYFSSKGHNSMGGYDVFKSTYNEATNTWSEPENMDFAISSTSDDLMFVSDLNNQVGYFASDRSSVTGKIHVYKVQIKRKPIDMTYINGQFIAEGGPRVKDAKITVVNALTGETIGTYRADKNTGAYLVKVPSKGGTYNFIVETTADAPVHQGKVTVDPVDKLASLRQEIRVTGEGENQKMLIKNMFQESLAEEIDPDTKRRLLVETANLEVNTTAEQVASEIAAGDDAGTSSRTSEASGPTTIQSNLTITEIIRVADEDYDDIKALIEKIANQSRYGLKEAQKKADAADLKFEVIDTEEDKLVALSGNDKKQQQKKVNDLKREANPEASEAIASYDLSLALSNEVAEKRIDLEELQSLQQQIQTAAGANDRKKANELYQKEQMLVNNAKKAGSALKIAPEQIKEKLQETQRNEKKTFAYYQDLSREEKDLKRQIDNLKKEAENTKNKKSREKIESQVKLYELDLEDIGFERKNVLKKSDKLKQEVILLKADLNQVNSIIEQMNAITRSVPVMSKTDRQKVDNQITYFKERNLLEGLLEEETGPATVAVSSSVPKIEAVDDQGNETDYAQKYADAEAEAAEEPNETERNLKMAEINSNWVSTLDEDIQRKKQQAESADEETAAALLAEVTVLEAEKSKRLKNAETYLAASQGEESSSEELADAQSYETGPSIDPVDAGGNEVDYEAYYLKQLEGVSIIADIPEKNNQAAKIHENWEATAQKDLDRKKQEAEQGNDSPELQAEIAALENEISQEQKTAEAYKLANTDESNSMPALDNEGNRNDYPTYYESRLSIIESGTAENKEEQLNQLYSNYTQTLTGDIAQINQDIAATSDAQEKQDLQNLANDLTQKLQAAEIASANVAATGGGQSESGSPQRDPYEEQLSDLQHSFTPDRAEKQEQILNQWLASLDNDIADLTTQRKEAKGKDKKAIDAQIERKQQERSEKEAEKVESENLANSFEKQGVYNELKANQIPTEKAEQTEWYMKLQYEAYDYTADANANTTAEEQKLREEIAELENEAGQVRSAYNKGEVERSSLTSAEKNAWYKQMELAALIGKSNKLEFNQKAKNVQAYIAAGDPSDENIAQARKLNNESRDLFTQAAELRKQADTLKYSSNQATALQAAYQLEMAALNKQELALRLSAGEELGELADLYEQETAGGGGQTSGLADNNTTNTTDGQPSNVDGGGGETSGGRSETTPNESGADNNLADNTNTNDGGGSSDTDGNLTSNNTNSGGNNAGLAAAGGAAIVASTLDGPSGSTDENETASTLSPEDEKAIASLTSISNTPEKKLTKNDVEAIEESEEYLKFFAMLDEAFRALKEAEVEYLAEKAERDKAAALQAKADSTRQAAEEQKKKEKKRLIKEAEVLDIQAQQATARADSIKASADAKKLAAETKDQEGAQYLAGLDESTAANVAVVSKANTTNTIDDILLGGPEGSAFAGFREGEASLSGTQSEEAISDPNYAGPGIIGADGEVTPFVPPEDVSIARPFSSPEELEIPAVLNRDIFVKADASVYSANKPIPVNSTLPQGLVYKVQIGAFRNPIPQDLFAGFAPLSGERTASGITRYTAGIFKNFTTADRAKAEIRGYGYSDAFVVAFLDGKRISLSEARRLSNETDVATITEPIVTARTPASAGGQAAAAGGQPVQNTGGVDGAQDVQQIGGLFFSVQVGVYVTNVTPRRLRDILPLNTERLPNGNVRYSTGVYKTMLEAASRRDQVRRQGINDAFVTAYYNGSRISIGEALRIQSGQ